MAALAAPSCDSASRVAHIARPHLSSMTLQQTCDHVGTWDLFGACCTKVACACRNISSTLRSSRRNIPKSVKLVLKGILGVYSVDNGRTPADP